MNLSNDNPEGCRQIARCGGLEILASLIAGHFPAFSLPLPRSSHARNGSFPSKSNLTIYHCTNTPLTDQELDFLIAILGLLVNLVEKDGGNRYIFSLTPVFFLIDKCCISLQTLGNTIFVISCPCLWILFYLVHIGNEKTYDHSVPLHCRSQLAAASVSLPRLVGLDLKKQSNIIPILCSIFLANQGTEEAAGEEKCLSWVRDLLYIFQVHLIHCLKLLI